MCVWCVCVGEKGHMIGEHVGLFVWIGKALSSLDRKPHQSTCLVYKQQKPLPRSVQGRQGSLFDKSL